MKQICKVNHLVNSYMYVTSNKFVLICILAICKMDYSGDGDYSTKFIQSQSYVIASYCSMLNLIATLKS